MALIIDGGDWGPACPKPSYKRWVKRKLFGKNTYWVTQYDYHHAGDPNPDETTFQIRKKDYKSGVSDEHLFNVYNKIGNIKKFED